MRVSLAGRYTMNVSAHAFGAYPNLTLTYG